MKTHKQSANGRRVSTAANNTKAPVTTSAEFLSDMARDVAILRCKTAAVIAAYENAVAEKKSDEVLLGLRLLAAGVSVDAHSLEHILNINADGLRGSAKGGAR